jgi:hypothetical protein
MIAKLIDSKTINNIANEFETQINDIMNQVIIKNTKVVDFLKGIKQEMTYSMQGTMQKLLLNGFELKDFDTPIIDLLSEPKERTAKLAQLIYSSTLETIVFVKSVEAHALAAIFNLPEDQNSILMMGTVHAKNLETMIAQLGGIKCEDLQLKDDNDLLKLTTWISDTTIESCDYCHSNLVETKKCSQCKTSRYCGKECQTNHWKQNHKNNCKKIIM